mgnify:CR=1 FL=1
MNTFFLSITNGPIFDIPNISKMINRTVGSPQIPFSVDNYNKLQEVGTHELVLETVLGDAISPFSLEVEVKESKGNEILVLWDVLNDEKHFIFDRIYIPEATDIEMIEKETLDYFFKLWGDAVVLNFDKETKRLYVETESPSIFF